MTAASTPINGLVILASGDGPGSLPTPSVIYTRARNRYLRALRRVYGGDGRRSGALFCARASVVRGAHGTVRRARFCTIYSRSRRPPCLLLLRRPARLGPGRVGRSETGSARILALRDEAWVTASDSCG